MSTLIAVSGRAEERAAPELAAVFIGVGGSGPDRERVMHDTSAAHARLLDEVRDLEVAGALDQWSAEQLRVWSHRPWNAEGKRLPLVHQVRADVKVVFRDLDRVGEWLATTATRDHLTVNGVDWQLTDATLAVVRERAQRSAVQDAVAKARVYADALGAGSPVPVELADHGMLSAAQAPAARMAMPMAAFGAPPSGGAPTTEFAPADLVIEARVDARFTAEPAG
ncbi:SIMPL domain-containing protein [Agromyces sp. LHK192]|uniref:SIMPL domain-containing protein n=1 Tax=Agromyces sp. LHK192 TaxID=2498704 RepID=UPI000FDCCE29|nr:SIMPL domain-containing protein [Agromyces sp. LHK192]